MTDPRITEAAAALERESRAAQRTFGDLVKAAGEQIDQATQKCAEIVAMRARLEPECKSRADARAAFTRLGFHLTVYENLRGLAEVDLKCNAYNLELARNPKRMGKEECRFPEHQSGYLASRARMDLALAWYYWHGLLDNIDTLLRATRGERAVEPSSPQEEEQRRDTAKALQAAFKDRRETAILAGTLASAFAETKELLDWGEGVMEELASSSPARQRELLADRNWAKLNGRIMGLFVEPGYRLEAHPMLAELMVAPANAAMALASANPTSGNGATQRTTGPFGPTSPFGAGRSGGPSGPLNSPSVSRQGARPGFAPGAPPGRAVPLTRPGLPLAPPPGGGTRPLARPLPRPLGKPTGPLGPNITIQPGENDDPKRPRD